MQNAIDIAEEEPRKNDARRTRRPRQGQALRNSSTSCGSTRRCRPAAPSWSRKPNPPDSPSSPNTTSNVLFGIVLGALLGFGLAALLERIDRRVRSVEEMEEIYELPLVGRIPRSRTLAGDAAEGLGTQTPEGEAFRILRANLRYFGVDDDLHTILAVSPEQGDGKSTVARGLAMTMAEMGDEVVLVEADLRKGSEFRRITGEPADGLSDVLAGTPLDRVADPRRRAGADPERDPRPDRAAERHRAAEPLGAAGERAHARRARRTARELRVP